jgi:hypothetical protein
MILIRLPCFLLGVALSILFVGWLGERMYAQGILAGIGAFGFLYVNEVLRRKEITCWRR